jgi:hypothetical protein
VTRRRLLIGTATAAALVLVGVFGVPKLDLAPEHHLDGEGPLGSFGDTNSSVSEGFDAKIGGPIWSAGLELCLARGDQPAVLDGFVGPTEAVGTGFRYLGALIREFTPLPGAAGFGSREGFPPQVPPVPEALQPVPGFAVTHRCQYPMVDRSIPITELVLGFSRTSDPSGGGWVGVDVGYTSGIRHHVVSLRYNFLVCGPAAPQEFCGSHATPTAGA